MRLTLFTVCGILLLLFGCGSDETPAPIEHKPNYFPDAVGSRWVYRTSEGIQSILEVSGETNMEGKNYRILKNTLPVSETEFDFLKPTHYRVTQNQVFFGVGEKIDAYVHNELPASVQDEFAGLELHITVEPIAYPELIFCHIPLRPNFQWDALNVKVNGSIILQNLLLLQIPFEIIISVTGEVVAERPLETPVGSFEKTYQIEYQTEITRILFSEAETTRQTQKTWFAPHVGIVKIEDEGGVTELIEYTLK